MNKTRFSFAAKTNRNVSAALIGCALLLGACAGPSKTAKLYSEDESMQKNRIEYATIISVQEAQIQGKTGIGGATGGALAGAAAGAQMGQGSGRIAGAALGALAGAALGKVSEEALERKNALEITVKGSDGAISSIVQTDEGVKFTPGQAVRLITSNGKIRVSP